jgi:isoamylase
MERPIPRRCVGQVIQRFLGSPDLYGHKDPDAESSLNFVTCHDGFTLNDLVSYDTKHNEANGEGNCDGSDLNTSWNGGVEGPTDDPAIERLRARQIKDFLVMGIMSIGVPMILMGDEVRRTQGGNNNAYAQDNLSGWFDWADVERHPGMLRFTRGLIGIRRQLLDLFEGCEPDWHGVRVGQPDTGPDSRSFALTFRSADRAAHVICNAYWEPLEFELPDPRVAGGWRRIIDTDHESPEDLVLDPAAAPPVVGSYRAGARSVVVLVADGVILTARS